MEKIKEYFKRLDFAILALFVLVINIPYLTNAYVPAHDTMYGFQHFYFFYNTLFFHGQIAQWMPYDSFGLPTNHEQLAFLTPMNYLVMIVGCIFRINEALILFKISIIIEQLIFLLGMWLLSGLIFSKRSTVYFVCLGALCNSAWQSQVYFDLHMFYLFPFVAYFLLLFFAKKEAKYFWLAGITAMAWIMGNVLYFFLLWFLILFVFFMMLASHNKDIWRCFLSRSVSNLFLAAVFILLWASFFYHLKDLMGFVDLTSRGSGARNAIGTYMHWGGVEGLGYFLKAQILGSNANQYVGLLPLIFFGWAMIKARNVLFKAFFCCFVVLFWLSFGGIFSGLCYFFPGMSYYRHIGVYVYPFLKVFILICAGFGLECFWPARIKTKLYLTFAILACFIFLFDSSRITGQWFTDLAFSKTPWLDFLTSATAQDTFVVTLLGYLFAVIFILTAVGFYKLRGWISLGVTAGKVNDLIKILIFLVFVFDISYFQCSTFKRIEKLPTQYDSLLDTLKLHPMAFEYERIHEPVTRRQKDATTLVEMRGPSKYTAAYHFIQMDPCKSQYNCHMYPAALNQFLNSGRNLDVDVWAVMGCHAPKLRFMTKFFYADDDKEAKRLMRAVPRLNDILILSGGHKQKMPASLGENSSFLGGDIHVEKFSANTLIADVNVPAKNGAWLVYADAYHQGWSVFVDDKKEDLFKAYILFKAVFLKEGRHTVKFVFHNGLNTVISYFFALFGVVAGAVACGVFLRVLFSPQKYLVFTETDNER